MASLVSQVCAVIYWFCILLIRQSVGEKLWRGDVTDRMNIGVSASGFHQIRLDCSNNKFDILVDTEDEFHGVVYTRGSFYSQASPCFLDANGGRRFRLKIPFDQCNVQDDGDKYQITVILQHDKQLIMPGDGAFALECDMKSQDNRTLKLVAMSSISLADPDPSGKDVPTHLKSTVSSPNSVIFKPSDIGGANKQHRKVEL